MQLFTFKQPNFHILTLSSSPIISMRSFGIIVTWWKYVLFCLAKNVAELERRKDALFIVILMLAHFPFFFNFSIPTFSFYLFIVNSRVPSPKNNNVSDECRVKVFLHIEYNERASTQIFEHFQC